MEIINDLKSQVATYYDSFIVFLPKLAIGLFLVAIFFLTARFVRNKLKKVLTKKADDPLLVNFINSILQMINIIIGFLIFLYVIGQSGVASSILGAAGVSAFIIGFAFKDIGENFLAGVIMAFNRPFRVGDTIETAGVTGNILSMSLRDTHMKTFDGKDVYIPNGQIIKNPLFNFTIDGYLRKEFTIGVDYDSDLPLVRELILESIKKVPGIILDTKPPKTIITLLGSSTINIAVQYWIDTFDDTHSST